MERVRFEAGDDYYWTVFTKQGEVIDVYLDADVELMVFLLASSELKRWEKDDEARADWSRTAAHIEKVLDPPYPGTWHVLVRNKHNRRVSVDIEIAAVRIPRSRRRR